MNVAKAFAIAGANLRRLLRDRAGAFFIFVFPFLIILALGAAFGSGFTPKLGIVDEGAGPLGGDLRSRLEATEGLDVELFADAEAMRTAIERGQVEGGLVLPEGFDQQIRAGSTVPLDHVARPGASPELELTVAAAVDELGVEVRAARFAVAEGAAPDFESAYRSARQAAETTPAVEVQTRTAGGDAPVGSFATGAAQELDPVHVRHVAVGLLDADRDASARHLPPDGRLADLARHDPRRRDARPLRRSRSSRACSSCSGRRSCSVSTGAIWRRP